MVPGWVESIFSLLPDINLDVGDETTVDGEMASQIDIDRIDNVDQVNIGNLSGNQYIDGRETESGVQLIIDPSSLDAGTWEEIKPHLHDGWIDTDNVTTRSAHSFYSLVRKNYQREEIHEILVYFEGKIEHRHHKMLEKCLNVGFYALSSDASRDEVRRRKKQIADTYGNEAWNIANLASSGYFDEDGLFRKCFRDNVRRGNWSEEDYKEEFGQLVQDIPFVIFVEGEHTASEILDQVIGKAIRANDYDTEIEFIDVRGIGSENHQTIDRFEDELTDYYDDVSYQREGDGPILAIRIDIETLER